MADRKRLIAGNWKMNKDRESAIALAKDVAAGLPANLDTDVVLCPAAPFLHDCVTAVSGAAHSIEVGAQNGHFEPEGAFTGEVSMSMITSTGAKWVILGHSERRHIFGESDELVGKKVRAALDGGALTPILCVGETIDEREAGKTSDVVLRQLRGGLAGLDAGQIARVVIAYEPVWAIGTGKTATPEQGQEVHAEIRKEIAALANDSVSAAMRLLYGGSVKPANVEALLAEPDIDGALVGGASLTAEQFLPLCGR